MNKAYIRILISYTLSLIEQIFPKARSELLRLLFADSTRSLHLRELARLSGLAVGTIQREVANLRNAGLILEERDGNRLYLKANTANPIFQDLRNITLKTTGLRSQLLEALEGLDGIDLAFVYGSFAGGAPTPASDVDLFIIGTIGTRRLSPALRDLANGLEREINPTVFARRSYAMKLRSGDSYIRNVTNGKKLWIIGSENELAAMAQERVDSPPQNQSAKDNSPLTPPESPRRGRGSGFSALRVKSPEPPRPSRESSVRFRRGRRASLCIRFVRFQYP